MKKYILVITLLILTSCGINTNLDTEGVSESSEKNTIQITSSIIPISSVINTIGGEFVEVQNLIPAGVSPHGFDLSAKDVVSLSNSDIVFMIGHEQIDGFLKKPAAGKKQIFLGDGIELIEVSEHTDDKHGDGDEGDEEKHDEDGDGEHDEHSDEDGHDSHSSDPHIWLGKNNILLISEKIRDELILIMPEQAEYFTRNTDDFRVEIEMVFADFATKIQGKTAQEFIVFHDAYNYLMESVGIESSLKIPFSKNVLHETGTSHMKDLINEVELHGIKYVFSEPQFSNGGLKKFSNTYNLTIGLLDPLGVDESADGYMNTLRSNLNSLIYIYE